MTRKTIVAFAVLASLLVVSATPATAASANLAVGSQYTSDTDFSGAETLRNVTVEGSGESASVALERSATSESLMEGFEDGSVSEYGGDTGAATAVTAPVYNGTYALEMDGDSSSGGEAITSLDYTTQQGENYSARVRHGGDKVAGVLIGVQSEAGYNSVSGYSIQTHPGNNEIILHRVDGGDFTALSSTAATIPSYEWLRYDVTWADDGTITVEVFDSSGTKLGEVSETDTTYESGGIGFRAFAGQQYFDDVKKFERVFSSEGVYTSSNHSVSNVEQLTANLTLSNASATVRAEYWDGSQWNTGNSSTVSSGGNHTLKLPETSSEKWRTKITFDPTTDEATAKLHDETYLFDPDAPTIEDVQPEDGTYVDSTETLSADISDSDFATAQNDSVTVEFLIDGNVAGSDTVSSNGTASTTWEPSTAGSVEYSVRATDSYGETTTSATHTLKVANELTIRNESNPSEVLRHINGSAEVTFYGSDTIEKRAITNGTVDMTGLPADEEFVAVVQADGFYDRRIIIDSLLEQQSVFLLNESATESVEVRFTNDDTTGNFPPESSSVHVEKAITINNTTEWRTLVADEFGVSGVTTQLEKNSRYRLTVKNQEGDSRVLGSYTASLSETVPLQPVSLGVDVTDTSSYVWTADYVNDSAGERLVIQFADPKNKTERLEVAIYEQGNRSNKLTPNQTFEGPLGNVSISEPLTENESNVTWVVEFTADRDGERIAGTQVAGQKIVEQIPGMPDWLQQAAAALFIILTGALFSQINHGTGAVVTGLVAGGFWVTGWLPNAAGPAVVIAVGVAVIYKVAFTSSAGGV